MSEIYKEAARAKLRFMYKGSISVEDLFDLSLTQLDHIYRSLKKQQGDAGEGLLQESTPKDSAVALSLEIVADVFQTKKADAETEQARLDRKAQKERIMEIIAAKQDEALAGKSLADLTAMLEAL